MSTLEAARTKDRTPIAGQAAMSNGIEDSDTEDVPSTACAVPSNCMADLPQPIAAENQAEPTRLAHLSMRPARLIRTVVDEEIPNRSPELDIATKSFNDQPRARPVPEALYSMNRAATPEYAANAASPIAARRSPTLRLADSGEPLMSGVWRSVEAKGGTHSIASEDANGAEFLPNEESQKSQVGLFGPEHDAIVNRINQQSATASKIPRRLMAIGQTDRPPRTGGDTTASSNGTEYPTEIERVWCVGRNYRDHIDEMRARQFEPSGTGPNGPTSIAPGAVPGCLDPVPPGDNMDEVVFFTKFRSCLTLAEGQGLYGLDGIDYEIELVALIGQSLPCGSSEDDVSKAISHYCVGCDLTKRGLQNSLKARRAPWSISKIFRHSAIVSSPSPAGALDYDNAVMTLTINGHIRQQTKVSQMIKTPVQLITILNQHTELGPGDCIFTGTASGVGVLRQGDWVVGSIDGLNPFRFRVLW